MGAAGTVPERDQQAMVVETLLMELDFQIKEFESFQYSQELLDRRIQTGVDYAWLITEPAKPFTVPQLVRLELEENCYKIHPNETGAIISAFRDALLRKPDSKEFPRILRTLVIQTIEKRPKEESLTEWVAKRTPSLTSLRLRSATRVVPINDEDDIESQTGFRMGGNDTGGLNDFQDPGNSAGYANQERW